MCFCGALALNVLRLALSAFPTDGFLNGSTYVSIIASPLACLLVTRSLLNLQAAYQRTTEWDTDNILSVIGEGAAVNFNPANESPSASFALASIDSHGDRPIV
ncbi:hypothetical protein C8Q74DRAFT_1223896 [Fomes fomentarius]|nr:hypothetical protein C8Q74DRAFT_1223896 [Fomes fomentarius]